MDLALDQNGDLALSGGDLVLITGAEEVAQRIRIRLRLFLGEWFLAPEEGMPYWQRILGHRITRPALLSIFRQAIQDTEGVASIESLSADVDGARRSVRISFRVTTDTGAVVEAEEVLAP